MVMDTQSSSFISARAAVPSGMTYVSIATAMLGAIMFGIDCCNFGSVIGFETFLEQWCVGNYGTYDECFSETKPSQWDNWFVMWGNTLLTVGAAIGAICLAPVLAENCGRRLCISSGAFIVFLGCILSTLSGSAIMMFYFSRVVTGFGIGTCCYALPIYSAETATPQIRGRMGSLFQWNTVFGAWMTSFIVQGIRSWYVGMMLPGIAGIIVAGLVWIVPESPRWTLKYKGREATAQVMTRIRIGDVQKEIDCIQEALDEEKKMPDVKFQDLFSPGLRLRVFVALMLQVCQQLTGVNAILGQSNTFFKHMKIPNPYGFNNLWTAFQLVGVTTGLLLVESPVGGRRTQLLWATCLMAPTLFIAAICLGAEAAWIWGAIMLILYGFGFQLAWGLVPWVYPSEIFKMNERTKAMGIAVFLQYGMNAVVFFTSPAMIHWSIIGTCIIFGCINAFNLIFVLRFVKETKGIPLEMVPQLFEDRAPMAAAEIET